MKTIILFTVLVLFMCISIDSSAQSSEHWALAAGGKHNESIHAIDYDDSGNIYVTGTFQDTTLLFGQTLVSAGMEDVFVASIKPDGSLNWLRVGGGLSGDSGADICVDHNYVYVVGTYRDQITIGDTLLNSEGTMDVFIVKYDLTGSFQWAESAGGVNEDKGKSIAVDNSGNIVITGDINFTAKFDDFTVPYVGFSDMFVAKYNGSGVCQWATSGGGSIYDSGECVEIAKNGDIVVAGNFNDQAVFDTFTVSSAEYADVFIARYSADGAVQEVVSAGGPGNEGIRKLAVDSISNIYISGGYMSNITIGSEKHYSRGIIDFFIAKYKPGSGFLWSKSMGGNGSDVATGMDLSPDNEILLTGTFEETVDFGLSTFNSSGYSDGFVMGMDTSGSMDWIFQVGGSGSLDIRDCVADSDGNIYLAGDFVEELIVGGKSFTPIGGYDLFLAKLNKSASGITQHNAIQDSDCYPNPFTDIVYFPYTIHQRANVQLHIYNIIGHLLIFRLDKDQAPGQHTIELNGTDLSPGVYFYTLETENRRRTGKIIKY